MNPHYPQVAARAVHRCEYCKAPESIFNLPFEVEHITPVSRGGGDGMENLALACRSCNLAKSNHLTAADPVNPGTACALFHPRRDVWEEHFEIAGESLSIAGKTPSGRATAELLRMNRQLVLEARINWSRLGLFP